MGADDEAAAVRAHGVDGVGDEVVEDLADVVFEADDGGGSGVGGFDADAGVGEASLIEGEDGVDEIVGGDTRGFDGLTMEAEGLGGDLADAGELGLGELDVGLRFDGEGDWLDEIEEIGDGLEGVVDLVGDGAGEAADGGELFALDEGGFGAFLVGDLKTRRR